jgi:hypothetical protein
VEGRIPHASLFIGPAEQGTFEIWLGVSLYCFAKGNENEGENSVVT